MFGTYACSSSTWVLHSARDTVRALYFRQCKQCMLHTILHIVCFPQVRLLRPHTMPAHHSPLRTAFAHGLARDSLSAAPTIYKLAHPHLIHHIPSSFCLFNTPSHIKHCSTYSVTYNDSDHTNSSEPVEGSQGSQS